MKRKWPGSHFFFYPDVVSTAFWRIAALLSEPPARRANSWIETKNKSRANPRADAAMKLLLPGAPNPEQVTPRGALRSMQRYRLHLGF
jgi:hypothetical protein